MLAYGASQAEIISITGAAFMLDFFAFQTDVSNALLAATIRAAGYIELQVLVKFRKAFFQLFHQPARESFGFRDGQFAELAAGAGHSAAPESRCRHAEPGVFKSLGHVFSFLRGYIHNHQVLRVRGAQVSVAVALRQICGRMQLLRSKPSAQYRCTHVKQSRLLLRMDSSVVAEYIIRGLLRDRR